MHLYVYPPEGKVRVSAPKSISDDVIEGFVTAKIGWIKVQQKKFKDQPRRIERRYVSGETIYVWGKQYCLLVKHDKKQNSIILAGDRAILNVRKGSTINNRISFVNEWYREDLKREIERRIGKWENATGLYCDSWQTKNMTTRWGTCNPETKKIWINLQLAKKPYRCLEYIILHELLHLKHRNHGKNFIDAMDNYMPNWRIIKKELNDKALDYYEENHNKCSAAGRNKNES